MSGTVTLRVGRADIPVRLTLSALAEIEEALGVDTLADLVARLVNPSAAQLIAILRVLARAGAPGPEGEEAAGMIGNAQLNLREVLSVLSSLFKDLMGPDVPGKQKGGTVAGAGGSPSVSPPID